MPSSGSMSRINKAIYYEIICGKKSIIEVCVLSSESGKWVVDGTYCNYLNKCINKTLFLPFALAKIRKKKMLWGHLRIAKKTLKKPKKKKPKIKTHTEINSDKRPYLHLLLFDPIPLHLPRGWQVQCLLKHSKKYISNQGKLAFQKVTKINECPNLFLTILL